MKFILCLLLAFPALANDAARHYFGDVELVNQKGETVRFYSDLLDGHVVVINTFFTECNGSCPLMSANYAALQEAFGDRVTLISISVDPKIDTPARLTAYAQRFKARSNWVLLTGSKANVDLILQRLGASVSERTDHMNVFFIGNNRTGLWKKAFGLAQPGELVKVVQSVIDDRG